MVSGVVIDPYRAMENLDLLYGTLDDPEQWLAWLNDACNLLRADGGNVVVTSHRNGQIAVIPTDSQVTPIVIENFLTASQREIYASEFSSIDWQREQFAGLQQGQVGATTALPEPIRSQYQETRFFQEFAKDTCLRNTIGGVFLRDERWLGNVGFHRYRFDDLFEPDERSFVSKLNAHTRRVLMQSEYITFLEDAVGALGGTLDAIYLIDQHGYVQYANAAASRLAKDGRLTVQDGRLVSPHKAGMSQLQEAIAACLTSPASCVAADFVIGDAECSPLVVSVAPNRRKQPLGPASPSVTKVVVTARDPQASPPLSRRVLAHVYRLTPRELDVCELLVANLTLRRIAEQLGIRYDTARTHLKAIFRKVGVNGQSELVQRVSALRA